VPTIRGSVTSKGFGVPYAGPPAQFVPPTGLAEDDVLYVLVEHDTGTTRAISGMTIVPVLDAQPGGGRLITLFREVQGASPRTTITATGGGTLANDVAMAVAYSGAEPDIGNEATVLSYNGNPTGVDPVTGTGLTVPANDSVLLGFSQSVAGTAGFTSLGAQDSFRIEAKDVDAGATGTVSIDVSNEWGNSTLALVTVSPPSSGDYTPTNLNATTIDNDSIGLTWDAVPGVSRYAVERDGVIIDDNVTTNSYTDNGLAAGTTYSYYVMSVLP
jgi:hypothetical protein